MTKWILAGLAALALLAPSAAAHTTIVEPVGSPYPYQEWVDAAKVPTPNATISVVDGLCPELPAAWGCTKPWEGTIWLNTEFLREHDMWVREIFLHELGHNFDEVDLGDWGRRRFAELEHSHLPWNDEEAPEEYGLEERFAEAYMSCALALPHYLEIGEAPYDPRICRLIRDAYRASTAQEMQTYAPGD